MSSPTRPQFKIKIATNLNYRKFHNSEKYIKKTCAITTNIGGLPNQIINGETGLVIKSNDADSIVNTTISLYDDPKILIEMKIRCYDYSKTNTWDKSAEIVLNFLESV